MSSSAGSSKASSPSQRQLTPSQLTSPFEWTFERLRTRLVETAPVEELDNFRLGAPIVAKRVDG